MPAHLCADFTPKKSSRQNHPDHIHDALGQHRKGRIRGLSIITHRQVFKTNRCIATGY
jgi:hypothetical protein